MTAGDIEGSFSTISLAATAAGRIAATALLAPPNGVHSKLRQFAMQLSQQRLQITRVGSNMNLGAAFRVHLVPKNQIFQVETQP
jgi:hypothetical protein